MPGYRRRAAAALAVLVVLAAAGCRQTEVTQGGAAEFGVYLGPGAKGVAALPAWDVWSGASATFGSDFEAANAWKNIEGEEWLLNAWQASGRRLLLAVPMLPQDTGSVTGSSGTLAQCAAGTYDGHWRVLADNLVRHQLATTMVRPGWEFNGSWFAWSAKGRESDFAGCFRRLVTAMRAASGQRFQFIWNVNIGRGDFPAELAFPGRDVVDAVGVDVYDVSWVPGSYPIPADAGDQDRAARRAAAWAGIYAGDHGLTFWAEFARQSGLRLTLPEWGLSDRLDGRGGGDNVSFVDNMVDFIDGTAVAISAYLNTDTAAHDRHRITGTDTPFPAAAARLQVRLHGAVSRT